MPEAPATVLAGARSFGLDRRLVIGSRSVAPQFKILLWPLREGDPLPDTQWSDGPTKVTVTAAGQTNCIDLHITSSGRTQITVESPGQNPVTVR